MDGAMCELPKYQCHKKVWALKIKSIDVHIEGYATLTPEEPGYAPFVVSAAWWRKHEPRVGGYYVAYENDYSSWSPADAFESGYTKI